MVKRTFFACAITLLVAAPVRAELWLANKTCEKLRPGNTLEQEFAALSERWQGRLEVLYPPQPGPRGARYFLAVAHDSNGDKYVFMVTDSLRHCRDYLAEVAKPGDSPTSANVLRGEAGPVRPPATVSGDSRRDAKEPSNAAFVDSLRAKSKDRLIYRSPAAEAAVRSFNIDCKARDGRMLPLVHVLMARLAQMGSKDMWVTTYVEERGGEVRIYDVLERRDGAKTPPEMSFEINKWGELRPIGTRPEALYNACFGSYGPIWKPR